MDPDALARLIRSTAFDLGFDLVGVAPAGPSPDVDRFRSWLESGFDGAMAYLARRAQERADPRSLVPEAQTVIVLGASYFVDVSTPSLHGDPSRGRIASYAWGDDYHEALKPLLFELDARIRAATGRTSPGRAYVDTGPILERSWAATAGLGFIGKNTCLIAPRLGSWVFLGVLLVPEVVEGGGWSVKSEEWSEKDEDSRGVLPSTFHPPLSAHRPSLFTCAACTRCLDVCPTQALPAPHLLDARRCISYLTIELDGPIPHVLRPAMGNWIFGFRQRFRNSPVRRTKRRGLLRNVCVALGNGNDSTAVPALVSALDDHEPLIRGHAAWALGRIDARIRKRPNPGARSETDPSDDRSIRNALTTRQSIETDPYVLHEIGDALEASLHTEN